MSETPCTSLRKQDFEKHISTAQKHGFGTWKLNGCPMDGGS
ncbi:MAG TPA: hypothetical protein VGB63_00680 [Pedobacter sp.]